MKEISGGKEMSKNKNKDTEIIRKVKILENKPDFKKKGDCRYFNILNGSIFAIAELGLTKTEILVYLLLLRRANGTDYNTAFTSVKGMSRDLKISERQINNAIKKLKELGLVELLEQGGTILQPDGSYKWLSNIYKVNFIDIEGEQVEQEQQEPQEQQET